MKRITIVLLAAVGFSLFYMILHSRPTLTAPAYPQPDPNAVAISLHQDDFPAGYNLQGSWTADVGVLTSSSGPYIYPGFGQLWKGQGLTITTFAGAFADRKLAAQASRRLMGPATHPRGDHLLGDVTLGQFPNTTQVVFDRVVTSISCSYNPADLSTARAVVDHLIQRQGTRLKAAGMTLAAPFALAGSASSSHVNPRKHEQVVIHLQTPNSSDFLPIHYRISVTKQNDLAQPVSLPIVALRAEIDVTTEAYDFTWSGDTQQGEAAANGRYTINVRAIDALGRLADSTFGVEVNDNRSQ